MVCIAWTKGKCNKGDSCARVHNPTCVFWRKTKNCNLGDKCLFPHRVIGGAYASHESGTEGEDPDDGKGPKPQAKKAVAKAKAKAKTKAKATPLIAPGGD